MEPRYRKNYKWACCQLVIQFCPWVTPLSIHTESLGLVTFIFCFRDFWTHRPPWGLHGHLAGRAGGSGRELSRQRADGRNSAGRFLRSLARWAPETWRPRRRNKVNSMNSEIPRFAVFFRCKWLMLKDVIKNIHHLSFIYKSSNTCWSCWLLLTPQILFSVCQKWPQLPGRRIDFIFSYPLQVPPSSGHDGASRGSPEVALATPQGRSEAHFLRRFCRETWWKIGKTIGDPQVTMGFNTKSWSSMTWCDLDDLGYPYFRKSPNEEEHWGYTSLNRQSVGPLRCTLCIQLNMFWPWKDFCSIGCLHLRHVVHGKQQE